MNFTAIGNGCRFLYPGEHFFPIPFVQRGITKERKKNAKAQPHS